MLKNLFVAIAVLIVLSDSALALGLGDITVFSKLNEPLKAHINIIDSRNIPTDDLSVRNASLSTYRRANLPKPEAFNKVRFKTTKLSNGTIIVVLTSKRPIKEPFITFIADARWPNGRLTREYTFLLDPPEFILENTRTNTTRSAKVSQKQKAPSVTKKIPSFSKKTQPSPTRVDLSAVIAAHIDGETYTTRRSDTLWDIAKKVRPDNQVTTYQTMQALFAMNPEAFINSNINLLKQNQKLKIPTLDEVLKINGKAPIRKATVSTARPKPSRAVLKKQTPTKKITKTSDLVADKLPKSQQPDDLQDQAQLKIIPTTEELLNKTVVNQDDLTLIKKALKTSISTIQLLHNENETLAAKINDLTNKLQDLDAHNDKLNSQISEISTLLNNKQVIASKETSTIPEEQGDVTTSNTDNIQSSTTEQTTSVEIVSDMAIKTKSRSFVRELLTSPIITFALAIFTIIILTAVLFAIRKQNEKRKQRKQNSYIHFSEIEQNKVKEPEQSRVTNNETVSNTPIPKRDSSAKVEKPEEEMDFFEYFEKKINAPDESPKEASTDSNASQLTKTNETEVDFSLDITDEEIQSYEKHITQTYKQSQDKVPDNAISEIDTYIAYGNYKTAEELILQGIRQAPDNKNLHLKLFECYSLNNKRYEFMQHIKSIINILNVDMVLRHRIETIYQQTWNEALNINKFT